MPARDDAAMAESISCPTCSASEMVAGVIVGRSPGVKFKAAAGVLGDLTGVLITTGFCNHSAPALRCHECGTVVVPPMR